jgi:hypothetical protein
MTDGDFGGGDDGGSDGGAFDLNDNGTNLDEFLLFAAITDDSGKPTGVADSKKQGSGCGCALPVIAGLLLALVAALT